MVEPVSAMRTQLIVPRIKHLVVLLGTIVFRDRRDLIAQLQKNLVHVLHVPPREVTLGIGLRLCRDGLVRLIVLLVPFGERPRIVWVLIRAPWNFPSIDRIIS